MHAVVVGYGEVGQAVATIVGRTHTVDIHDPAKDMWADATADVDALLVCFPFGESQTDFVNQVQAYINLFQPKCTIVFSTVAIGTCSKIGFGCVHVPVEGKHPVIEASLNRRWDIRMGGFDKMAYDFLTRAFGSIKAIYNKPEHTEFLKLRSTTLYGLNIEFARYCDEVCYDIGLDYKECVEYDMAYNQLYTKLGLEGLRRQLITYPPRGAKGGHCVTPNAKILNTQYPNPMVKIVAIDGEWSWD